MKILRGLLGKYKRMPDAVKASLWFTVCSFFQKGIAFLTTPIFTRIMTTQQYGQYSVFMSWDSIIIIFATLSLVSAVYNNCMVKYEADINTVTSSFLGLTTAASTMVFSLFIIIKDVWYNFSGLTASMMLAMFLTTIFEPAYQFWACEERFHYRYKKLVVVTFALVLVHPIAGIIAVYMSELKTEARIWSYAIVVTLFGLFFYIRAFRLGKRFYVKEYWKFALGFNVPLIPHFLSQTILNQSDRIMIGKMVSEEAAGLYSLAYTLASVLTIVITSINASLVPFTYKSIKNNSFDRLRKNSKILFLTVASACVLMMLLGPELIWLVGGEKYLDAKWVIPPVVGSVYVTFLYSNFANVEFYFEKTKPMMWASVATAILNIILNYLLIPAFGYVVAGYTTLVSFLVFDILHYLLYRRIIKEKNLKIYDMKVVLGITIIVLVCVVASSLLYNVTIIRYGLFVLEIVLMLIFHKQIIQGVQLELSK